MINFQVFSGFGKIWVAIRWVFDDFHRFSVIFHIFDEKCTKTSQN